MSYDVKVVFMGCRGKERAESEGNIFLKKKDEVTPSINNSSFSSYKLKKKKNKKEKEKERKKERKSREASAVINKFPEIMINLLSLLFSR
jgi:hypothetical protein